MVMVTDLTISTIPYLSEPDQVQNAPPVNACPRPDRGASAMTEESHRFAA
jgi:hypothetical protein